MKLAALLCLFVTGSLAVAQQPVTVPSNHANSEAPSRLWVAGVGAPIRQQVLIDAVHLTSLIGRSITSIAFRRDTQHAGALTSGNSPVVVRMAISPHVPEEARPDFGANAPGAVTVFSGTLSFPSSSSVTGYQGWVAPHIVEIPLTVPFAYAGGTLCVDVDAVGASDDSWWPIDAVEASGSGSVVSSGGPCGRLAWMGTTAWVSAADLMPGNSARFYFHAEPAHVAVALIGAGLLAQPMDLALIGAPGCTLEVAFFTNAPFLVPPPSQHPDLGGVASLVIDLPAQPALIGSAIAMQWADIGPPLVSSNALLCTLASGLPDLGMSTVVQKPGELRPQVFAKIAPVVRLGAQ